jgi:hypothetical protein
MLFSAVQEERILRFDPGTGKADVFRNTPTHQWPCHRGGRLRQSARRKRASPSISERRFDGADQ